MMGVGKEGRPLVMVLMERDQKLRKEKPGNWIINSDWVGSIILHCRLKIHYCKCLEMLV